MVSNSPKLTKGIYSPKELKRLKAKLRGERSRSLSPLKTVIDKCEADILTLEADVTRYEHELVDASTNGEAERIRELSQKMHNAKARIDELFSKLTGTSEKHDSLASDFEMRLNELE